MRQHNLALCLAAVLFYMVLITTWLTGGLLAKFVSTDSGMDEARVAAFVFDTSTLKKDASVIPILDICNPGESLEYKINVTNKRGLTVSEVSIGYSILIEKQGSMPLKCTLTNVTGGGSTVIAQTQPDKIIAANDTISGTGKMTVGTATEHEYVLIVEWPESYKEKSYASGNAIGEIKITVGAQQED